MANDKRHLKFKQVIVEKLDVLLYKHNCQHYLKNFKECSDSPVCTLSENGAKPENFQSLHPPEKKCPCLAFASSRLEDKNQVPHQHVNPL